MSQGSISFPPVTHLEADFNLIDLRAIPRGTHFETYLGHLSGQKTISRGHISMWRLQKALPGAAVSGLMLQVPKSNQCRQRGSN